MKVGIALKSEQQCKTFPTVEGRGLEGVQSGLSRAKKGRYHRQAIRSNERPTFFLNSFASTGKQRTRQTAQLSRPEVALCDISLSFLLVKTEVIAEHNNMSLINRNLEL